MSAPLSLLVGFKRTLDRIALSLYNHRRYIAVFGASISSAYLVSERLFEISASEGVSMYATIPDRTNMLCINKLYRRGRGIKVGDCVQIANPLFPRQFSGKRVIGMPGDYVLRSKSMSPTPGGAPLCGVTDWRRRIDGDALVSEKGLSTESVTRVLGQPMEDEEWDEPEMIQVPEGHVWVEGDNLGWSRDSRFFGPLPMALIKGRSSWFSDGWLSITSLNPGKGLRKVEDWEMDAVLGHDQQQKKRRG